MAFFQVNGFTEVLKENAFFGRLLFSHGRIYAATAHTGPHCP